MKNKEITWNCKTEMQSNGIKIALCAARLFAKGDVEQTTENRLNSSFFHVNVFVGRGFHVSVRL